MAELVPGQTGQRRMVSARVQDAVEGGLADNFDGTITNPRWEPWNYKGKQEAYSLAFAVDIIPDPESDIKPFTQWYSAGSLDDFTPSRDGINSLVDAIQQWDGSDAGLPTVQGPMLAPIGDRNALINSCNFIIFLRELVRAGWDDSSLANAADVSSMNGLRAHFARIPQPTRGNLKTQRTGSNADRTPTILVVSKILGAATGVVNGATNLAASLSPQAAIQPAAQAAQAAQPQQQAQPATTPDEFTSRVYNAVLGAIASNNGTVNKSALAMAVMNAFDAPQEKGAAIQALNNPQFYANGVSMGMWQFNPSTGQLSLGG